MEFDEMMQQLKEGQSNEFEIFGPSLGALMAKGLNQLNPDDQEFVVKAMNDGGEIFALCRIAPLYVAGMLTYQGQTVEIFRVTPDGKANYRKLN